LSEHPLFQNRQPPLELLLLSKTGARVLPERSFAGFFFHGPLLSAQIDACLRSERFPDLVLIWIGHHDIQWRSEIGARRYRRFLSRGLIDFKKAFADDFISDYEAEFRSQILRLLHAARTRKNQFALILFGQSRTFLAETNESLNQRTFRAL